MKTGPRFISLFTLHLRFLPWQFLLILFMVLADSIDALFTIISPAHSSLRHFSGLSPALTSFPLAFYGLLGVMLIVRDTGYTGTPSAWLLPGGEFVLTRPISRRQAFRSLILLYFVVLLSPSLLNLAVSAVEPELRLSVYHVASVQGRDELSVDRHQFPTSVLTTAPSGSSDTLIIPFGSVLISLWNLWLTLLLALVLEFISLPSIISSKLQVSLLVAASLGCLIFEIPEMFGLQVVLENGFFFFLRHWSSIALFTLGLFVSVQWVALKRIANLEIL